ncbi:MAG: MBL fold metallo-hydrolase [Bacteroidales bacterium]|nr:MBL fold metallo-hydrolase [Bacteroidales bacterium]
MGRLSGRVVMVKMGAEAITAIATQQGIVVVDAGLSHSLTARYRKAIEKELGRNDFTYLINTHGHPDHTGGNQVFSDAVIIGHDNCPDEIRAYWKDPDRIRTGYLKIADEYAGSLGGMNTGSEEWEETTCQKIRYGHAAADLTESRMITIPSVTFNDRLSLSMGDVTLDLIWFGKAHSTSDIIIHVPEEKLLFTGDLFTRYGRPGIETARKRDVERWKSVMQWIRSRREQIGNIIGGHGLVMTLEDLDAFGQYVDRKWEEAEGR